MKPINAMILLLWIQNGFPEIKSKPVELYYPKLLQELLNLKP